MLKIYARQEEHERLQEELVEFFLKRRMTSELTLVDFGLEGLVLEGSLIGTCCSGKRPAMTIGSLFTYQLTLNLVIEFFFDKRYVAIIVVGSCDSWGRGIRTFHVGSHRVCADVSKSSITCSSFLLLPSTDGGSHLTRSCGKILVARKHDVYIGVSR